MKSLPFACLLAATAITAHGQVTTAEEMVEREERVFKGGIVAGANFCQVDGDSYAGYGKVGLLAGGLVSIRLGKVWNINVGMQYSGRGTRAGHVDESPYVGTFIESYYLNLKYVDVPVLFQFKRALLWGFEGGISYSRLISSKEWGYSWSPVYIDPEINRFNNTDISTLLGGYRFLNKNLVASLRFQYSAINIRPAERVPERYNMFRGQRNNVVSFFFTYIF